MSDQDRGAVQHLVDQGARAIDTGDDVAALESLAEALTLEPSNAFATWQVGRYYGRKEQWADAAEQFHRAVRLDGSLSRVEFAVQGEVIRLVDVPGSSAPAAMLGEFSRDLYQLRSRTFHAADVVVDVGAHIGAVAIILARLHPAIRVIAYEPSTHNFAMLQENLRLNQVGNVVAVREAIAGEAGSLELLWNPLQTANASSMLSSTTRDARAAAGWEREQVRAITLDQAFDQHRIDRCAFLKLDCEGAEWEIVRHAAALERVVAAAIELHLPSSRQAEGAERLQQEFAALLTRRRRWPETSVPSIIWLLDS